MGRSTTGFGIGSGRRGRVGSHGSGRGDSLNPAARRPNRSLRAAEFDQFARSISRDLNPRGPLETLVTRQAIRSAWRLKESFDGAITGPAAEPPGAEADRAARSLEVAITTLELLRGRRDESVLPLVAPEPDEESIEPNEWPVVPSGRDDADGDPGDLSAEADAEAEAEAQTIDDTAIWRGRLLYDFDVSDHSPVIRGTWITVSHVVSLIVDGATWADILRAHPELTESDIRVCVAYAVAEDSSIL